LRSENNLYKIKKKVFKLDFTLIGLDSPLFITSLLGWISNSLLSAGSPGILKLNLKETGDVLTRVIYFHNVNII